jgi:hypothetical protein
MRIRRRQENNMREIGLGDIDWIDWAHERKT